MNATLTADRPALRPAWIPWAMLPSRLALFTAFQALFALGYFLAGSARAWDASAAWWPFTVSFSNLVCVGLLITLFRSEGKSYWAIFRISRENVKKDLLTLVWLLVITVPVAMLPNFLLASWLFGDSTSAMSLFIRHLPMWAAVVGFLFFPITQGLAELATYFLYVEPRLEEQLKSRWVAVGLSALALGLQHVSVPLVFNPRYLAWRGAMFIPFAILLGIVLRWRPRLLPYLAIIHILMDMGTAAMLFTA